MKKVFLSCAILAAIMATSCKKTQDVGGNNGFGKHATSAVVYPQTLPKQTITGNITTNTTLTNDKVWELDGFVAVTNNAVLTIQPGTFIIGKKKSATEPGTLIITKGAKLTAIGTEASPIVFTSYKLVDNDPSTTPVTGDFGGVILLGNAPINVAAGKKIEGIPSTVSFDYTYGGSNAADNSGSLKYVRIEYPGAVLEKDNEINGLTLGGVGNGTLLDYIQVSYSKDDSFEWFGGTVNATHLISLAPDDDNFDFDNGYSGKIQFAVAVADINGSHNTSSTPDGGVVSDSNGIESDNNAPAEDATFALTPRTRPVISNMTIVGTESTNVNFLKGARWRRGTRLIMANSIIMGYPVGVEFKVDNGVNVATDVNGTATGEFSYNLVQGFSAASNNPLFPTPSGTNSYYTTTSANSDIALVQPFYNTTGALDFRPDFGSPADSGASFASANLAGLTPVAYRGAFGSTDWTATWSNFFK